MPLVELRVINLTLLLGSWLTIGCSVQSNGKSKESKSKLHHCTAYLKVYDNDPNYESILVLAKENDIHITRKNSDGMYISNSNTNKELAKSNVSYFFSDHFGHKYVGEFLNCFYK